jgi:hypothetical protein
MKTCTACGQSFDGENQEVGCPHHLIIEKYNPPVVGEMGFGSYWRVGPNGELFPFSPIDPTRTAKK